MKIRTAIIDIFILLVFLAGSVYSYSRFKTAYDYALIQQKLQYPAQIPAELAYINPGEYAPAFRPEGPAPVPVLISPLDGSFFYNGPGNGGLYFYWRKIEGAGSYTIRISTRKDLRQPLFTETVGANCFLLSPERLALLPETAFYWGVMQTDSEGEVSTYSPPRSFRAGLWP